MIDAAKPCPRPQRAADARRSRGNWASPCWRSAGASSCSTWPVGGTLIADVERDVPDAVAHRRAEEDLIRPLHAVTVDAGSRLGQWMGV